MGILSKLFSKKEPTEELVIKVAGVTFKNGRKSRQTILRQIKFRDEPFDKHLEYKLEEYDFEGEPAIGVYVNDQMIGNVPRDKIQFLLKNADRVITISKLDIIGGGTVDGEKISYGARVSILMKKAV